MSIGIPVKLMHEAHGHVVTMELKTGYTYRGKLIEVEDNMNVQIRDVVVTARDGRVTHLDQAFVRGGQLRFVIVPDMLRNAPMFQKSTSKGRGVGIGRGKATVARAQQARDGGDRGRGGRGGRGVARGRR